MSLFLKKILNAVIKKVSNQGVTGMFLSELFPFVRSIVLISDDGVTVLEARPTSVGLVTDLIGSIALLDEAGVSIGYWEASGKESLRVVTGNGISPMSFKVLSLQ